MTSVAMVRLRNLRDCHRNSSARGSGIGFHSDSNPDFVSLTLPTPPVSNHPPRRKEFKCQCFLVSIPEHFRRRANCSWLRIERDRIKFRPLDCFEWQSWNWTMAFAIKKLDGKYISRWGMQECLEASRAEQAHVVVRSRSQAKLLLAYISFSLKLLAIISPERQLQKLLHADGIIALSSLADLCCEIAPESIFHASHDGSCAQRTELLSSPLPPHVAPRTDALLHSFDRNRILQHLERNSSRFASDSENSNEASFDGRFCVSGAQMRTTNVVHWWG